MRIVCIFASALALSGCGQAMINDAAEDIPPPIAVYEMSASDRAVVESGVRAVLKDPTSAMFGPMTAAKRADGMVSVCGEVNAKNSFGGYAGMKPFNGLMTLEPAYYFGVTSIGGTQIDTDVTIAFCQKMMAPAGYPVIKGVDRHSTPKKPAT